MTAHVDEIKVSAELVSVLYLLLPGFTAAYVFYGFTAHKKPSPFERPVQALIFTGITVPLSAIAQWLLFWAGRKYGPWMEWSPTVSLGSGMIVGTLLGVVASFLANTNLLNYTFSKLRVTKRTSFSSEWYSVFHSAEEAYVYLTFKDERRSLDGPSNTPIITTKVTSFLPMSLGSRTANCPHVR